jgi:hypothetical protein
MGDIRCDAMLSDDFDRATRYDAERAWKLVIANINDDHDAVDQIIHQIGDCQICLGAIVRYLAGANSGQLLARGGKEFALKAAHQMLTEVLESPDLMNPDAGPG